MTIIDTYTTIANGDQLDDGYFNGGYDAATNTSSGHDHDGVNSKSFINIEESSHLTNILDGGGATEQEMGEIIIDANECRGGALVIAVIEVRHLPANNFTGYIRTGTSNTATSNTIRMSAVHADAVYGTPRYTMTLMWWCNEETLSNQWYIHVTGKYSATSGTNDAYMKSLVAIKL